MRSKGKSSGDRGEKYGTFFAEEEGSDCVSWHSLKEKKR
jgi:hypothetical protein